MPQVPVIFRAAPDPLKTRDYLASESNPETADRALSGIDRRCRVLVEQLGMSGVGDGGG